jgi:uncharacterized membrane protein YgcG
MKRQILLLAITAAALSSCTTAYKTGQTPDDVYFSPTRPQDEYVRVKEKEENQYDNEYYDDRYLRMKVHNHTQWNTLDDWYSYERYGYSYNYYDHYYGSYYNPYTSWNYYYNPYCRNNVIAYYPGQTGHPGVTSVAQNVPKPRTFNLASYTNTSYNNANSNFKMNSYKTGTSKPIYNNRNSNDGFSNTLKQIFNTANSNSSNSSYTPPSRSYSPSSSNSSGSSGSSGSPGSSSSGSSSSSGATRPSRGGN